MSEEISEVQETKEEYEERVLNMSDEEFEAEANKWAEGKEEEEEDSEVVEDKAEEKEEQKEAAESEDITDKEGVEGEPKSEEKSDDKVEEEPKADEPDSEYEPTKEEFEKFSKSEKGLYHTAKKERAKRQELEQKLRDLEIQNKTQFETLKSLHNKPKEEQVVESEAAKVADELQKKEAEGELLTFSDMNRLREAEKIDRDRELEKQRQDDEVKQREARILEYQQLADKAEAEFKKEHDDYDHVFDTIVQPIIEKELQQHGGKAGPTLQAILRDPNPAAYAYFRVAMDTPEGKKYFADKSKRVENEKIIDQTKEVTETSVTSQSSSSETATQLTPQEYMDNMDKYANLPEEKKDQLCMGKPVMI